MTAPLNTILGTTNINSTGAGNANTTIDGGAGGGGTVQIGNTTSTNNFNGTTTFNGTGIPAANNVVTINNVPAGKYGLMVDASSTGTSNGINITGNAASTGTGINVTNSVNAMTGNNPSAAILSVTQNGNSNAINATASGTGYAGFFTGPTWFQSGTAFFNTGLTINSGQMSFATGGSPIVLSGSPNFGAGTAGQVMASTGTGSTPQWTSTPIIFIPFSNITSGTNTTATMIVGSGASLNYTGTGTINASSLEGSTWEAPGTIGSTTPNTGKFTTLSASAGITSTNGVITSGTAATNNGTLVLTNSANASTATVSGSGVTASGTVTMPQHPAGELGVYLTNTATLVPNAGGSVVAAAVAGAAVGDPVLVTYTAFSGTAGQLTATVTGANTVTVNSTSISDAGTVRIIVLKQ